MTTADDINFFFEDPTVDEKIHEAKKNGRRSVLYALRREIQDCLLDDNENKPIIESDVLLRTSKHRLFATSMMVFSAFDLMAKFYAGEDDINKVGARFIDFLKTHGKLTESSAREIWIYRNSLMHSF